MVKKIVIESQHGVGSDYNIWATEAVKEFLDLFPEHRDKFAIESRGNYKPDGSEIDQEQFDLLPDNMHKKLFIKLDNGKYLVPYASTDWYIEQARNSSGDKDKLDVHILGGLRQTAPNTDNITLLLACDTFKPFCYGCGHQNISTSINTTACNNKNLFKNIIKHELGHVFRATYEKRNNVVQALGEHCTNADCLMEPYSSQFTAHLSQNETVPFCNECMESMREYIRSMAAKEKTLTISNSSLPPSKQPNSDWKKPLRKFYTKTASKEGSAYVENIKSVNYQAQLKRTDGSITNIEASSINNITMSAVDKDGNPSVPKQEYFDKLVEYARENNLNSIKLADIKTPEFKARLVLACMSAVPPMKMENGPALDETFFNGVDADTRQKIETIMQQQIPLNNQPNTSAKPAPAQSNTLLGGQNYIDSRNKKIAELEQKQKLNTITPQEKAQLEHAKLRVKMKQEYDASVQRTGNSIDPRTAEHETRTGLKAENYYYSSKSRKGAAAWKLHLDVMPNRNDPTTKAVSDMLEALDVEHKIYHGGENGKGMTIYIGSYEDAKRLSKEINLRFGKEIAEPPIYTDQAGQETMFNPKVSGRFYLQSVFQTQYPRGTVEGICPATYGSAIDSKSEFPIFAQALKEGVLPQGTQPSECFGLSFNWDFDKKYTFEALETYCAHKLYAKEMGEYYHGKDSAAFEQKMFGNILPPTGSGDRIKWEKIATLFVKHMTNDYPHGINEMHKITTNYTPVDFNKLPPLQNNNQHGNGRP